ncbi:NADH-quinone oxidoreductase subunit J [Halotalea alkalilenta]|uniref:NADH-quinone oxidoreductase subunit J n=1 Tax=Halotalea alkalilenta TaxID=376489 RepID=UPI000485143C|nr:NADH-quinone oxidoreductase subunit J [Halotalea alkalilenta]
MEFAFYLSAAVAILATIGVVTGLNPVHALLNLIVSLIAIAMVFFSLGAPFAGILEIIVYAGAIMVLFVFVVMMLNLGEVVVAQERAWLKPGVWVWPSIMAGVLLGLLIVTLLVDSTGFGISGETQTPQEVGTLLFGPYLVAVELAAFLLLAALVTATHVGRDEKRDDGRGEGVK